MRQLLLTVALLSSLALAQGSSQSLRPGPTPGNPSSAPLFGGISGAQSSSSGCQCSFALPAGQSLPTILDAPLTLYVNGSVGSDANDCTSPGVGACATIGGALRRAPLFLRASLTVAVAPYDAGYPGYEVPPFHLIEPGDGGTATVNLYGETLVDPPPGFTSPTSGTAVGGNNTGGPNSNWPRIQTSGGLVAQELRGNLVEITGGTGAGCATAVYDNDTTYITLTGPCSPLVTFDATTTWRIRRPILSTGTVSPLSTIDGGVQTVGVLVQSGWVQPRAPFFGAFVTSTNLGIEVSSGVGLQVIGNGGFQVNRGWIVNKSTSAATFAIKNMGGSVRVNNSYVESKAAAAFTTQSNTLGNTVSFSNAMFVGGASGTGSVVDITGSTGVISNAAIRIASNTASMNGLAFLGVQNSQLTVDVDCAGSNNIGMVAIDSSSNAHSTSAYFNHIGFNNCGTGMKIDGPGAVRIGAAISIAGTIGTLFDISHGARVRRQGTCTETGFTTYLNMDGQLWAGCAEVADAGAGTQGGDIMDLVHGTAWDSFP